MRYDKNKMSIKGLVGQHSTMYCSICSSMAEGVSITIVWAIKRETNQVAAAHFVILLSLVCSSVSQCLTILINLSFQFSPHAHLLSFVFDAKIRPRFYFASLPIL